MPNSDDSIETYWFPTPQELGDETHHAPIQKRIFQELIASHRFEQRKQPDDQDLRDQFLSNFDCTD